MILLSLLSVVLSLGSALAAWRAAVSARRLARRYADAIRLIAVIARVRPAIASPHIVALCEQLLDAHGVETRVETTSGVVH